LRRGMVGQDAHHIPAGMKMATGCLGLQCRIGFVACPLLICSLAKR
jgi:hypothetical protein